MLVKVLYFITSGPGEKPAPLQAPGRFIEIRVLWEEVNWYKGGNHHYLLHAATMMLCDLGKVIPLQGLWVLQS